MIAFRIDEEHDGDHASNGKISRYGNYLRRNEEMFADGWGTSDPVRFAGIAWSIANEPIMTPGYVQPCGRVLGSRVHASGWDGSLTAEVTLATEWPAALARDERAWRGERGFWRSWSAVSYSGTLRGPGEEELTRSPYLLTTSQALFTLDAGGLPPVPAEPGPWAEQAARVAVAALVKKLNAVVGPIIEQLEK
ncbi:hypothetical protein [Streptosporangium oxazolinicum]|uniref:hypothetical protein n=1 Tax=Streptosporangium oxazolinicum TaxID=909287 RepID=UPI0031EDE53C